MGALSELTMGEITRGLARYRPVAATLGAILVAIAVLPKAGVELADVGSPIPGRTTPVVTPAVEATEPAAAIDSTETTSPSSSFGAFSSSPSPTLPFSSSSPSGGSTLNGGSSSAGSNDTSTSPTTTIADGGFTPAPTTSSDQPLRVVAKAYASRTAGTPLAADGVPKGTLPVGTRAGQDDKRSFVRLSGDETVLRLLEDTTGRASVQGPAAVRACQVTVAGWKEGEALALQDAPAYDTAVCVDGARSLEGIWLFDLSSFPSRTDQRGFALVPGKAAGVDFQVAFRPS